MGQGLTVVVLAAGEGKRFRSAVPKPLHPVAGRPLLWHVLAAAAPLKGDRTVVVVGNGADEVAEAVRDFDLGAVEFAVQASQRGTGDALAAIMSGSGPTMLGLCRDEDHATSVARAARSGFARVEVARGPVPGVTFG